MNAAAVFGQNDGEVTKDYYARMNALGPLGELAVSLFRAQKRSAAAKSYRRGKFRRSAYDVKNWSLSEISRVLESHPEIGFRWGWKQDTKVVFGEEPAWVLYVDLLEIGQCSFHSPDRGKGPDYSGEWDGRQESAKNIIAFCDQVGRVS